MPKICEAHDDSVVVWDFGKTCPWCKMVEELKGAKYKIVELEEEIVDLNLQEDI